MDGSRNILWGGGDNNILGARIIGENLDIYEYGKTYHTNDT